MKPIEFYYNLVKTLYGETKAERSKVPYMNHIDEGLQILDYIDADNATKSAYCIHPIFQIPKNLKQLIADKLYDQIDQKVLLLAMEYRNKANAYVCRPRTDNYTIENLPYMVLPEVTAMLIADKVQNYKDFLQYHKNSHPRSKELDKYFNLWFKHLHIDYTQIANTVFPKG